MICGVSQEEYPKHVIYGTTLDFATSVALNAPSKYLLIHIHSMLNVYCISGNSIYVSYPVAKHLQQIGRFNVKYARELECEVMFLRFREAFPNM